VFADLGFPDAAARQPGLRLAYALNQELEARKISQADAAQVMGLTQPNVSALRRYKLEGFSVERLMKPCDALDQDVEIVIRRKPRPRRAPDGSVSSPQSAEVYLTVERVLPCRDSARNPKSQQNGKDDLVAQRLQ
jgi:predicted XRE-type DNA-binding protein